jgi:hypothetical protein
MFLLLVNKIESMQRYASFQWSVEYNNNRWSRNEGGMEVHVPFIYKSSFSLPCLFMRDLACARGGDINSIFGKHIDNIVALDRGSRHPTDIFTSNTVTFSVYGSRSTHMYSLPLKKTQGINHSIFRRTYRDRVTSLLHVTEIAE